MENVRFHYLLIDFILQNGRQNVWFFVMRAASFYIHHIQGQVHNCQNLRILLTIYTIITSLSGENCEHTTVLRNQILLFADFVFRCKVFDFIEYKRFKMNLIGCSIVFSQTYGYYLFKAQL